MHKRGLMFRHIQVLTKMLNDFQNGSLLPAVICIPIFIIAMVALTLVKRLNTDFIFVSTLVIILLDCLLVIMALFGQMATVCEKSSQILYKMS